jgi:uncharacterized protein
LPLAFFALTYAVSWTLFGLAAVLARRAVATPEAAVAPAIVLLLLGTIAPSLVGVLMTATTEGRAGLARLWARLVDTHVPARWFVFAVGYMAAIKLGAAVLHRMFFGAWPAFGTESWFVIAVAIVTATPIQAGEEVGWRGYALPQLVSRLGLPGAALTVGVFWAVWHLPLFFVPGIPNYGQSFLMFAIGSIGLSIALTWLYANTKGSLLLAMLMHSAVNQTIGIVPTRVAVPGSPWALDTSPITIFAGVLLLGSAIYFLVRLHRLDAMRAGTADSLRGTRRAWG